MGRLFKGGIYTVASVSSDKGLVHKYPKSESVPNSAEATNGLAAESPTQKEVEVKKYRNLFENLSPSSCCEGKKNIAEPKESSDIVSKELVQFKKITFKKPKLKCDVKEDKQKGKHKERKKKDFDKKSKTSAKRGKPIVKFSFNKKTKSKFDCVRAKKENKKDKAALTADLTDFAKALSSPDIEAKKKKRKTIAKACRSSKVDKKVAKHPSELDTPKCTAQVYIDIAENPDPSYLQYSESDTVLNQDPLQETDLNCNLQQEEDRAALKLTGFSTVEEFEFQKDQQVNQVNAKDSLDRKEYFSNSQITDGYLTFEVVTSRDKVYSFDLDYFCGSDLFRVPVKDELVGTPSGRKRKIATPTLSVNRKIKRQISRESAVSIPQDTRDSNTSKPEQPVLEKDNSLPEISSPSEEVQEEIDNWDFEDYDLNPPSVKVVPVSSDPTEVVEALDAETSKSDSEEVETSETLVADSEQVENSETLKSDSGQVETSETLKSDSEEGETEKDTCASESPKSKPPATSESDRITVSKEQATSEVTSEGNMTNQNLPSASNLYQFGKDYMGTSKLATISQDMSTLPDLYGDDQQQSLSPKNSWHQPVISAAHLSGSPLYPKSLTNVPQLKSTSPWGSSSISPNQQFVQPKSFAEAQVPISTAQSLLMSAVNTNCPTLVGHPTVASTIGMPKHKQSNLNNMLSISVPPNMSVSLPNGSMAMPSVPMNFNSYVYKSNYQQSVLTSQSSNELTSAIQSITNTSSSQSTMLLSTKHANVNGPSRKQPTLLPKPPNCTTAPLLGMKYTTNSGTTSTDSSVYNNAIDTTKTDIHAMGIGSKAVTGVSSELLTLAEIASQVKSGETTKTSGNSTHQEAVAKILPSVIVSPVAKPEQKNVKSPQISSVPPETTKTPLKVSMDENGELSHQISQDIAPDFSAAPVSMPQTKLPRNLSSVKQKLGDVAKKRKRKHEMASKFVTELSTDASTNDNTPSQKKQKMPVTLANMSAMDNALHYATRNNVLPYQAMYQSIHQGTMLTPENQALIQQIESTRNNNNQPGYNCSPFGVHSPLIHPAGLSIALHNRNLPVKPNKSSQPTLNSSHETNSIRNHEDPATSSLRSNKLQNIVNGMHSSSPGATVTSKVLPKITPHSIKVSQRQFAGKPAEIGSTVQPIGSIPEQPVISDPEPGAIMTVPESHIPPKLQNVSPPNSVDAIGTLIGCTPTNDNSLNATVSRNNLCRDSSIASGLDLLSAAADLPDALNGHESMTKGFMDKNQTFSSVDFPSGGSANVLSSIDDGKVPQACTRSLPSPNIFQDTSDTKVDLSASMDRSSSTGKETGLGSFSKEELFEELAKRHHITKCICGCSFLDYTMYMLHRASHNTDKPHMCAYCGKVGRSWMDFYAHMCDHSK